jgi:hypothetical protein
MTQAAERVSTLTTASSLPRAETAARSSGLESKLVNGEVHGNDVGIGEAQRAAEGSEVFRPIVLKIH